MQKFQISLRTRLLGLVLAVIVLIGVGSFYSLSKLEGSYEHYIESQIVIDAVNLGKVLSAQLSERCSEVQTFAVNRSVSKLNKETMTTDFNGYTSTKDEYDLIIVVDKNGKFVASNSKDSASRAVHFENLQKIDFTKFDWFTNTLAGKFTSDKMNNITGTVIEDFIFDELTTAPFDTTPYGSSFTAQIKKKYFRI